MWWKGRSKDDAHYISQHMSQHASQHTHTHTQKYTLASIRTYVHAFTHNSMHSPQHTSTNTQNTHITEKRNNLDQETFVDKADHQGGFPNCSWAHHSNSLLLAHRKRRRGGGQHRLHHTIWDLCFSLSLFSFSDTEGPSILLDHMHMCTGHTHLDFYILRMQCLCLCIHVCVLVCLWTHIYMCVCVSSAGHSFTEACQKEGWEESHPGQQKKGFLRSEKRKRQEQQHRTLTEKKGEGRRVGNFFLHFFFAAWILCACLCGDVSSLTSSGAGGRQ